jgi:hypothetical protein
MCSCLHIDDGCADVGGGPRKPLTSRDISVGSLRAKRGGVRAFAWAAVVVQAGGPLQVGVRARFRPDRGNSAQNIQRFSHSLFECSLLVGLQVKLSGPEAEALTSHLLDASREHADELASGPRIHLSAFVQALEAAQAAGTGAMAFELRPLASPALADGQEALDQARRLFVVISWENNPSFTLLAPCAPSGAHEVVRGDWVCRRGRFSSAA